MAKGYGDWRALVEDPDVQAVAIATLPSLQAQIATTALALGKPVFAEKPMANDLASARAMLRQAKLSRLPTMIDFNFPQIMAWQRAKAMLEANAIGALRHVTVHWHVESRALQMRMRNWKTVGDDGGGVLGNFIQPLFPLSRMVLRADRRNVGARRGPAGRRRAGDDGGDGDAISGRAACAA